MSGKEVSNMSIIDNFQGMRFAQLFEPTPNSVESSVDEIANDVIKIKKELISHLAYLTVTNLKRDYDHE